ncbi:hypothetical protein Tco_1118357, partial [Tanacetum coccineum]
VSLLLTPLYCDDIHDVTPRVSALAGCDIVSFDEDLVKAIFTSNLTFGMQKVEDEDQDGSGMIVVMRRW